MTKTAAAGVTAATGMMLMGPQSADVGAALVPASGLLNGMGLVLQTGGALYLAYNGDTQPAQNVALQLAQTAVNDMVDVPQAADAADPVGNAMEAAVGEDSCTYQ